YFWRDVQKLIVGFLRLVGGRRDGDGRPDRWGLMALYIAIATVPLVLAGLYIERYVGNGLRKMEIIAWTMPIFGVVLYLADRVALHDAPPRAAALRTRLRHRLRPGPCPDPRHQPLRHHHGGRAPARLRARRGGAFLVPAVDSGERGRRRPQDLRDDEG